MIVRTPLCPYFGAKGEFFMKEKFWPSVHAPQERLRTAFEIGCCLALVLSVLLSAAAAQYRTVCNEVCAGTLRLHILANSDTLEDQILKLKVRDAVLAHFDAIVGEAADKQEAETAVRNALPELEAVARQTLRSAHSSQSVRCSIEQDWFEAKDYGTFRLPSGEFTALRIELGRAEGHNWFCVLYPSLCAGASTARYETAEENALVFGEYEVRFALADSLRAFWRKVSA